MGKTKAERARRRRLGVQIKRHVFDPLREIQIPNDPRPAHLPRAPSNPIKTHPNPPSSFPTPRVLSLPLSLPDPPQTKPPTFFTPPHSF